MAILSLNDFLYEKQRFYCARTCQKRRQFGLDMEVLWMCMHLRSSTNYVTGTGEWGKRFCDISLRIFSGSGRGMLWTNKKNSCFPSQRASLLESASRRILFFISLNLMYLALQLIVFLVKADPFCSLF